MRYLFDKDGQDALRGLASVPSLLAFDFDGTLCPIVPSPDAAKAEDATLDRLRALAARVPVAIVSGRSLSDLSSRVKCEGLHLVGNHGAEGLLSDEAATHAAGISGAWARHLRAGGGEGELFVLEDKGLSLSLHYRHVKDREAALARLHELVAKLRPRPRIVPGKLVLNLLPEGSPHKGAALVTLLRQHRRERALFVGDDVTDEDVFGLGDERVIGVLVGQTADSSAGYFLREQGEMPKLLDYLLDVLPPAR